MPLVVQAKRSEVQVANGGTPSLPLTRLWIAIAMVSLSAVGVIAISWVAIGTADATDRADTATLVFSSVLPLLGTWVGTILAFYFARENLEAATASTISTIRLAGGLAPTTPVTEAMIPRARITAKVVQAEADAPNVTLAELQTQMNNAKHRRIPILDSSDVVLYVVHDSTIAAFAASQAMRVEDLVNETMAQLLASPVFKGLVEAIGSVGPSATIADARAAMRSVQDCNDVFVTQQGKRKDPALGWLTNTDLAAIAE